MGYEAENKRQSSLFQGEENSTKAGYITSLDPPPDLSLNDFLYFPSLYAKLKIHPSYVLTLYILPLLHKLFPAFISTARL